MAKLRELLRIENDIYKFVFDLESVSESDRQLLCKFSPPDVDFGGTFDNGMGLSFSLPNNLFALVTGFPVVIAVDTTVPPFSVSTSDSLNLYRSTMETRITAAFAALRANTDTFTGEFVVNI